MTGTIRRAWTKTVWTKTVSRSARWSTDPEAKFTYLYDFGDGWRHTVTVEKIEPIPVGHGVRLTCLAGKRRCPPEDVGGPFGYGEYLHALADPEREEHQAMLDWRGEFDPTDFDPEDVNAELAKLARWSRPRKTPPALDADL